MNRSGVALLAALMVVYKCAEEEFPCSSPEAQGLLALMDFQNSRLLSASIPVRPLGALRRLRMRLWCWRWVGLGECRAPLFVC